MLSVIRMPSSDDERRTRPPLRIRREHHDREAQIFEQGQPADQLYQVVSGSLLTYRMLRDGRRQLEALHFAGDAVGLESGKLHRFSAKALSTCIVLSAPRAELDAMAERRPDVARRLLSLTTDSLRRSQRHAMNLARRSARERMAAFMLELDERTNGAALLDLPMTRQDVADYLSLTVETVSRVLTHFQQRGYIALPTARQVLLQTKGRCAPCSNRSRPRPRGGRQRPRA